MKYMIKIPHLEIAVKSFSGYYSDNLSAMYKIF